MFKHNMAAGAGDATKTTKTLFKHIVAASMSLPLRYLCKHLNMAAWKFGNFPHRRG